MRKTTQICHLRFFQNQIATKKPALIGLMTLALSSCAVPLLGLIGAANPLTSILANVFLDAINESVKEVLVDQGKKLYLKMPAGVRQFTDPIVAVRKEYLALEQRFTSLANNTFIKDQEAKLKELLAKQKDQPSKQLAKEIVQTKSKVDQHKKAMVQTKSKQAALKIKEQKLKKAYAQEQKSVEFKTQVERSKAKLVATLNALEGVHQSPMKFDYPSTHLRRDDLSEMPKLNNSYLVGKVESDPEIIKKVDWRRLLEVGALSSDKIKSEWNPKHKLFSARVSDNLLWDLPLMGEHPELADAFNKELNDKITAEANTYKISIIKR